MTGGEEVSRKKSKRYLPSFLARDESTDTPDLLSSQITNLLHTLLTMKKERSGLARTYRPGQYTFVGFTYLCHEYCPFPYHVQHSTGRWSHLWPELVMNSNTVFDEIFIFDIWQTVCSIFLTGNYRNDPSCHSKCDSHAGCAWHGAPGGWTPEPPLLLTCVPLSVFLTSVSRGKKKKKSRPWVHHKFKEMGFSIYGLPPLWGF